MVINKIFKSLNNNGELYNFIVLTNALQFIAIIMQLFETNALLLFISAILQLWLDTEV